MAGYQTPTSVTAIAVGDDAIASLQPEMYPRMLVRLVITGAANSKCEVYLGSVTPSGRVDQTARGSSNTAEYANPVTIPAGSPVHVVWPGKAAQAQVSLATFVTERYS